MFKVKNTRAIFIFLAILYLVILAVIFYFDRFLSVGIFIITFLSLATSAALFKSGIKTRKIYLLFFIAILIHLLAVVFIYYCNFYPFGGGAGDQIKYNEVATELASRFKSGNFSIEGYDRIYPNLYVPHIYPILIGAVYAVTAPSIIIGESLNVWLVALAIIFLYLVVLEINGSEKNAFIIGLIATFYPSYLYFGSLLTRDPIVICFTILSLLLIIKIIKNFSWLKIVILLLAMGVSLHFRFYIGIALILIFILSWFFVNLELRKKIIFGVFIFLILGFLPYFFSNQGYYGTKFFKKFITPETVTFFRETGYNPHINTSGTGSSVTVRVGLDNPVVFVGNTLKSSFYVFVGPLPWQIKYPRQLFALLEIIPWYLLIIAIFVGIRRHYKKHRSIKVIFPLLVFGFVEFLVLGFFIDNFGAYMRIRIPVFLALLCLADFSWFSNIKNKL